MRCLVTGGSGFIGFNLLLALKAESVDGVMSLDRASPPAPVPGVEHVRLDIANRRALHEQLQGVDVVFHLAAAANVDRTDGAALAMVDDNVGATAVLLDAARTAGVGRFVLASSVWVYMGADDRFIDEETKLGSTRAMNLYAATKLSAEVLCRAYSQQFGMPCTILRFETPYGPYMRPDLVVYRFLRQALNGDPITIAGDGRQTRNFIHVSDLVRGIVMAGSAAAAAGRTYNLPGPAPVSIRDLAQVVCDVTRSPSPILHVPGRANDSEGPEMGRRMAEADLGWRPEIGIREGIRLLLPWLITSGAVPAAGACVASR